MKYETLRSLRRLVEFHPDLILIIDSNAGGTISAANAAFLNRVGGVEDNVLGRQFADYVHPDDVIKTRQKIAEDFQEERHCLLEQRIVRENETYGWVEAHLVIFSDGQMAMIGRDIDARKREESKRVVAYERLAKIDPLTGLLNRRGLSEKLNAMKEQVAVALVDVDDFKSVNERFGHAPGDAALKDISFAIETSCRPTDYKARVGGDEFMILFEGAKIERCVAIMERVQQSISLLGSEDFVTTVSAGLVDLSGHKKVSITTALEACRESLAKSKSEGKDAINVATMPAVEEVQDGRNKEERDSS